MPVHVHIFVRGFLSRNSRLSRFFLKGKAKLSSVPIRAPHMKPPQVLGGSCPSSYSCTAIPQVTDPSSSRTPAHLTPAGPDLQFQGLIKPGSREEESSAIMLPQMEGDVRCSLQPFWRAELGSYQEFLCQHNQLEEGRICPHETAEATSRGDLMQQKHNSAGTFLWEAQKSRAAPVTILMYLHLQIQQQTSHPETHTLGSSQKQ